MVETLMKEVCLAVSKHPSLEEQNKELKKALKKALTEWANCRAEVERLEVREKVRAESGASEEDQDADVFEVSTD